MGNGIEPRNAIKRIGAATIATAVTISLFSSGCRQTKQESLEDLRSSKIARSPAVQTPGSNGESVDVPKVLAETIKANQVDNEIQYISGLPVPSSSQLELLAGLYLYKQDYKQAQSSFQTLSERQPDNPNHLVRAGFCAILDARSPEGFALLKKASDVAKFDVPTLTSLSIIFVDMGRGQEAMDIAKHALQLAPDDPNVMALMGHVNQGYRNYQQAEDWYQKALAAKPQHYFASYYLAQLYRDSGRYEKAAQLLSSLSKQNPKRGWPQAQMGYCLVVQNKVKDALPFYKRAVDIEPNDGLLWSQLGHEYMCLSNYSEAQKCYRKALSLQPGIRSASYMLVPLYALDGNDGDMLKLLNSSSNSQQREAQALLVVSMSIKPSATNRDLKQKRPDNLPFPWIVDLIKGETNSLNNNFEDAESFLNQATAKSNHNILARFMHATHLLRCHRDAEAVDEFRQLDKLVPNNSAILSGLALGLVNTNRLDEAAKAAHEAIAIHPNFRAWYALGLIAEKHGQKEETLFAFREASRLRAFDPMIELDLSHRLNALGDETQSKAALKPLINAEPEETDVWLDVVTNFQN